MRDLDCFDDIPDLFIYLFFFQVLLKSEILRQGVLEQSKEEVIIQVLSDLVNDSLEQLLVIS